MTPFPYSVGIFNSTTCPKTRIYFHTPLPTISCPWPNPFSFNVAMRFGVLSVTLVRPVIVFGLGAQPSCLLQAPLQISSRLLDDGHLTHSSVTGGLLMTLPLNISVTSICRSTGVGIASRPPFGVSRWSTTGWRSPFGVSHWLPHRPST